MPNEHELRRRIAADLAERRKLCQPIWFAKQHGSRYTRPGIPDWILCIRSLFVAIETKKPGETLSPVQRNEQKDVLNAGGGHYVVETFAEYRRIVESYLRGMVP